MSFFRTHAGISSQDDQERIQREDLAVSMANMNPDPMWKDISRKMRATYLGYFVDSQAEKYGLNSHERDALRQVINIGITQHYFTSDDISFREGRIASIQGLLYNPEHRTFYIHPALHPRTQRTATKTTSSFPSSSTNDGTPRFFRNFRKYIKDQEKKGNKERGPLVRDPSLRSELGSDSLYSQSPSLTIVDEST